MRCYYEVWWGFFSLLNGEIGYIKLEELIDFYQKSPQEYTNNYEGNLFCRECRLPKLSFVNHKFLRGYRGQVHDESCSNHLEKISSENLAEHLKNATVDYVNKKLHNLINELIKKQVLEIHPLVLREIDNGYSYEGVPRTEIKCGVRNLKRIPVKSLTAPFFVEDFDVFKLFYGTVRMEWQSIKNGNGECIYYYIRFYTLDKDKLICSLKITKKVYAKLNPLITNMDKIIVNTAFATEISEVTKGINKYKNAVLWDSHYLVINPL